MTTRIRSTDPVVTSGGGGGPAPSGNVAWGPSFGEGTELTVSFDITSASSSWVSTNGPLASKDVWIPNVALCPDPLNKNLTDLQVSGVVATRTDSYMGWDLSTLPAGASVSAASLIVNLKTAPAGATGGINLNHLSDGDEGWAEATLACGGALPLTNFQNEPAATWVGTGDKTITLNATARSRIAARMGAGVYSIVFTGGSTLYTSTIFQSKDSLGTPANGPRLALAFTKAVPV